MMRDRIYRNKRNSPDKQFMHLCDNFFHDVWKASTEQLQTTSFKMDVMESAQGYTILADMAGIEKKQITLKFDRGYLTIAVCCEEAAQDDQQTYLKQERLKTEAQRTIYLPGSGAGRVTAALTDGLLRVTVSKDEGAANPAEIEIN